MSIPVNTPSFVDTPSTQAFQNWESPSPNTFIYAQTSANVIYPAICNVKIKDIIGTPEASGYTEFRLRVLKSYIGTSNVNGKVVKDRIEGNKNESILLGQNLGKMLLDKWS